MKIGNVIPDSPLARLRKSRSLTQTAVAGKIGCDIKSYRSWEIYGKRPNTQCLIALADLFDVSTDYILGLTDFVHVEYRDISELTGLSEAAIIALREPLIRDVLNTILASPHGLSALRAVSGFLTAARISDVEICVGDDGSLNIPPERDLVLEELEGGAPDSSSQEEIPANYVRVVPASKVISEIHLGDIVYELRQLRAELPKDNSYTYYSRSLSRRDLNG